MNAQDEQTLFDDSEGRSWASGRKDIAAIREALQEKRDELSSAQFALDKRRMTLLGSAARILLSNAERERLDDREQKARAAEALEAGADPELRNQIRSELEPYRAAVEQAEQEYLQARQKARRARQELRDRQGDLFAE